MVGSYQPVFVIAVYSIEERGDSDSMNGVSPSFCDDDAGSNIPTPLTGPSQ